MATETNYNRQLLQPQDGPNMDDFIVSFNVFGEFDHFEDWDAAQEKEEQRGGVALAAGLDTACRPSQSAQLRLVKKKNYNNNLILIYFVGDHGISGIRPDEVSIFKNKWT